MFKKSCSEMRVDPSDCSSVLPGPTVQSDTRSSASTTTWTAFLLLTALMLLRGVLVLTGVLAFFGLLVAGRGVLAVVNFFSGLLVVAFLGVDSCLIESESLGGDRNISFPDPSPFGASGERTGGGRGCEDFEGVPSVGSLDGSGTCTGV